MRDAVRRVRARAPFGIDARVVLPDHMHCVWTLPPGDAEFPGRRRASKTAFVKGLPAGEPRSSVMTSRGDYTHFNPVKHGLVEHPADWPYSSFRQCVEAGLYPDGWRDGGDEPQETGARLRDPIRSDWRAEQSNDGPTLGYACQLPFGLRWAAVRAAILRMPNCAG